MRKVNIPLFIPNKGCPNDCVFCNQHRITGELREITALDVKKTVDSYLETTAKKEVEIAFFGGSFTGLPIHRQNELLEVAFFYKEKGIVNGIRLSTRADYIDDAILQNLKHFGVTTIEIGAQSTDEDVLRLAKRNHTAESVIKASKQIKEYGFTLGLQMMTGLLGSSIEKDLKTCYDFIALAPSIVRIYPTIVVEDTELCDLYKRGEYTPQTLEEAIELCSELIIIFEQAGITVIRTGLQPSDSLNAAFVAGPYHESFGEMARSRVILKKIVAFIEKEKPSSLDISVNPRELSKLIGQKKENIKFLNSYGLPIKINQNSIDYIQINGIKLK